MTEHVLGPEYAARLVQRARDGMAFETFDATTIWWPSRITQTGRGWQERHADEPGRQQRVPAGRCRVGRANAMFDARQVSA